MEQKIQLFIEQPATTIHVTTVTLAVERGERNAEGKNETKKFCSIQFKHLKSTSAD